MRRLVYVRDEAMERLLESLEAGEIFVSIRRETGPQYANLRQTPDAEPALREPRPSASPKSFLQPVRERVAVYSADGPSPEASAPPRTRRALAGLRACDLKAIQYLDKVFREGLVADPFYAARRQADLLIAVDCVQPHETCFCTALGGSPFAETGFDLNLTPLDEGYLVEVGSDRGQAVLDARPDLASDPTDAQARQRESVRRRTVERLDAQNQGLRVTDRVQEVLLKRQDSDDWNRYAADCVECAACTFICPTCHCFYLYDQAQEAGAFERLRTWDSCLLGDYARMAGPAGAKPTPRPRLRTRFANRVLHKYAFSPQQYALLGCTGCGRCIEACFGNLDLRQVLREFARDENA